MVVAGETARTHSPAARNTMKKFTSPVAELVGLVAEPIQKKSHLVVRLAAWVWGRGPQHGPEGESFLGILVERSIFSNMN